MLDRLAIAGYRSLRDVRLAPGRLTIVTGTNGSGKSSLYRALRLLSETAQGRLAAALAEEGGLASALWAGAETISRDMRAGRVPVQGTVRSKPVSLKLGCAGDDFGFAIDLGLPTGGAFPNDPEIKAEAMWQGGKLRPSTLLAERHGAGARVRRIEDGTWRDHGRMLASSDTMVMQCADTGDGLELMRLRERLRGWRFYDALRTDREAPARQGRRSPTFTPALGEDGGDVAAAIATIDAIGDGEQLAEVIADAFPGASLSFTPTGLAMRQPGLLRPVDLIELSDGTLRYLMLAAALLSPRPPELMALNEPEASLHPSLIAPLARLLLRAARECQIIVVSHNAALVDALYESGEATLVELRKEFGETEVIDGEPVAWTWPTR
jgi:predicted ATPase